jgi:hypothetical protein
MLQSLAIVATHSDNFTYQELADGIPPFPPPPTYLDAPNPLFSHTRFTYFLS